MAAAVYNVNLKRGAKHLSANDCALKFVPPKPAPKPLTEEEKAAKFRSDFDAHKQLLMAIANQ